MNKQDNKNKICFVICWLGKLPSYLPVWLKTCENNKNFDFLILTDDTKNINYPSNVKFIPFSKELFISRVKERICDKPSIKEAYRLCDYRPMYGVILKEELKDYHYWGYCDIDLIFGNIESFLPLNEIEKYDAIFNGGHFTLIKNSESMNHLYEKPGAIFNYKIVTSKHAIFAFDETTGFQRIARTNKINAKFGIPYIETESKYKQLRSRLEMHNPNFQAFYWEDGCLYRVKAEDDEIFYQEIAYIHLQKRKIEMLDNDVVSSDSFWITPKGYKTKYYKGIPSVNDIKEFNPYEGEDILNKQASEYKKMKLIQILKRNPFQIYVRIMQQKAGINAGDGTRTEMQWLKV